MTNEIREEIQKTIERLVNNKRQGFLTIPQALMEKFSKRQSEIQESVQSGVKTEEEANLEFESFIATVKEEAYGLTWVVNLRDPETKDILVQDCTINELEGLMRTGELVRDGESIFNIP